MADSRARALLKRQLKKHGFSESAPPQVDNELAWQTFLDRIEKTYLEYDAARLSSENILDVSLKEMEKLQNDLSDSNRKKLQEVNEHLSLLLYASDLGTWDWNLVTNQVSYDKRWCEIMGLTLEETPQKIETFRNLVHPDDFSKVFETARDYIGLKIQKYETRCRMKHKDGHWVGTFAKGKITGFDANGKPIFFTGTVLDITEEDQMRVEMEAQRVRLIQSSKMAALGELSAGVAHEINNPLTIVTSNISVIRSFIDDPEVVGTRLDAIDRATTRISKIVNGLRKFSRSSEKKNYRPHSLRDVVKEALTLTEIKSKTCNTVVQFEGAVEGQILCDEIEIEQVLINLVNNAIDAVKGQVQEHRWVKVSLFEEGGAVVLQVRDSGSGIPTDVAGKLFQPFFTTKPVGEGTGIGLSIVSGILSEHGATITVLEQDPNTCFEVRFARAETHKQAA